MKTRTVTPEVESVVWPDEPAPPSGDAITVYSDHSHLKLDPDFVRTLIQQVLETEQKDLFQLEIILTGNEEIRDLNKVWRNADYDTDVLSFSLGRDAGLDGIVFVNLEFAASHCKTYKTSFHQEACRYIVHGLLHLLGYQDNTSETKRIMRQKEDQILESVGFSDI